MDNERPTLVEDEFCVGFSERLGPLKDGVRFFSSVAIAAADMGGCLSDGDCGSTAWHITTSMLIPTASISTSLDFDVHSSSSAADDPPTDPSAPTVVVIVVSDEFRFGVPSADADSLPTFSRLLEDDGDDVDIALDSTLVTSNLLSVGTSDSLVSGIFSVRRNGSKVMNFGVAFVVDVVSENGFGVQRVVRGARPAKAVLDSVGLRISVCAPSDVGREVADGPEVRGWELAIVELFCDVCDNAASTG